MKLFKLSLLPALAVLGLHSLAVATQPTAAGVAGVTAHVSTNGAMSIGNNGAALSYASSSQSAQATLNTTAAGGRTGLVGETATQSAGMAYNTSTGAATGAAQARGSVAAAAQGLIGSNNYCPPTISSGGVTSTQSNFAIKAGRDQGSSVQGSTASGFETVVARGGSGVQVSTTGFVTGANATHTLSGMNPASVANIQASGSFNAIGQSGVGTVAHRP